MYSICELAGVNLPARLPLTYKNGGDYYDMQTSLVLEESRYKLAEALEDNLAKPGRDFHSARGHAASKMELVDMEAPKKKKVGFTLQFKVKSQGRGRHFTMEELLSMKPGSVFEVSYTKAGNFTPAPNETVQLTMLACITPSKYELNATQKSVISLTVFPKEQLYLRQGTTWTIKYVTTLISEQRQFEACIKQPHVPFLNTLLGWQTKKEETDARADAVDTVNFHRASPILEKQFLIPKMNIMQEKTAIKFLKSPSSSITLVQGPPGE